MWLLGQIIYDTPRKVSMVGLKGYLVRSGQFFWDEVWLWYFEYSWSTLFGAKVRGEQVEKDGYYLIFTLAHVCTV